jgi:hypothetical protein
MKEDIGSLDCKFSSKGQQSKETRHLFHSTIIPLTEKKHNSLANWQILKETRFSHVQIALFSEIFDISLTLLSFFDETCAIYYAFKDLVLIFFENFNLFSNKN